MEGKKGVAIPYIIALVIGIIVLVFIVYWVYRLFTAPQISYEDCRARLIQWCNMCAGLGWTDGTSLKTFVDDQCYTILNQRIGVTDHDCAAADAKTDCKKVGVA